MTTQRLVKHIFSIADKPGAAFEISPRNGSYYLAERMVAQYSTILKMLSNISAFKIAEKANSGLARCYGKFPSKPSAYY